MEYLVSSLASLAYLLPLISVWVVAVVIAVRRWERHRTVSAWLLTGVGICFTVAVAGHLLAVWMPMALHRQGRSISEIGLVSAVLSAVWSLASAGGWAFVIAAVFGERQRAAP